MGIERQHNAAYQRSRGSGQAAPAYVHARFLAPLVRTRGFGMTLSTNLKLNSTLLSGDPDFLFTVVGCMDVGVGKGRTWN